MLTSATLAVFAAALSVANAGEYLHYPPVSRFYELNGLSDRFYKKSVPCVQECLKSKKSTEMTPCPVWDTGCLCVFTDYNESWLGCILDKCPEHAPGALAMGRAACTKAGVPPELDFVLTRATQAKIDAAKPMSPSPAVQASPKADGKAPGAKADPVKETAAQAGMAKAGAKEQSVAKPAAQATVKLATPKGDTIKADAAVSSDPPAVSSENDQDKTATAEGVADSEQDMTAAAEGVAEMKQDMNVAAKSATGKHASARVNEIGIYVNATIGLGLACAALPATCPLNRAPDAQKDSQKPMSADDVAAMKPSADLPAMKPSADLPAKKPSADLPAMKPSADLPAKKPSADLPAKKPSSDLSAIKPSADLPAKKPSAEELASGAASLRIAPLAAALCLVVGVCVM